MADREKPKSVWDVIGTLQLVTEKLIGLNKDLTSLVDAHERTIAGLKDQVAGMTRASRAKRTANR